MKINFKILEGLRGIAALYVVINHCRGHLLIGGNELSNIIPFENWTIFNKIYYLLLQFTSLGSEFVVFFFVLSGFSIAHSIKNNSVKLNFYKKRLIRLYPVYLIALIYANLIYNFTQLEIDYNEQSVFSNIESVIQNIFYNPTGELIPQFWSLPLEVIFYIIAPFILFSENAKKYYYYFSIAIFIISSFYSLTNENHPWIIVNYILDYNIYFAVGIYLYSNFNKISSFKIFCHKRILWISTIILIPLMILINIKLGHYNKLSFSISGFYAVILIINFIIRKIDIKILQKIGEMSYTLYVSHFASMYLFLYIILKLDIVNEIPITNPFIWIFGVAFCIVSAIPCYYLAEKPSIKLLKKIRARK